MCAVHDGRCSPWVMCSVVSGNRIHDRQTDVMKTDVKINVHIISASFRRFTICFCA